MTTLSAWGQSAYAPQGGEYAPAGPIAGDQVYPQLATGAAGGYVVWQDNVTDGSGTGISAQRINNNLSGSLSTFRVNALGAGDQQFPQVALLNDGGAVFVWQGPAPSVYGATNQYSHIFARFLKPDGTFASASDVAVSSYASDQQITPMVAKLANGNVVFVWSSFRQDGDLQGVYARIFSAAGQPVTDEFRINTATALNQRTPSVAALAGGGFAVSWISEVVLGVDPATVELGRATGQYGVQYGFNVMARVFAADGTAVGAEFKANTANKTTANPSLAGLADGGFTVAWSEQSAENLDLNQPVETNGWDVVTRKFTSAGAAASVVRVVNGYTYGDQFAPRISALGNDQMVVWTSLGQDGDRHGIFGRTLLPSGEPSGPEFQVNTETASSQMHPAVGNDGGTRFLVVWSSYVTGTHMDLFAQRYASTQPLLALPAPFVAALSGSKLAVSWPSLAGYNVVSYGLYIDGSSTPISVTGNSYTITGLVAGSSHSVRIDYLLADGRRANPSSATTAKTWGEDGAISGVPDGLPDDWQATYWGGNYALWPKPWLDSDGDGVSNLDEFLAGTNPLDAASVLKISIGPSPEGWLLGWNTQPGFFYQVVTSSDLKAWTNVGGVRFAAGNVDSMLLNPTGGAGYYKVLRIR